MLCPVQCLDQEFLVTVMPPGSRGGIERLREKDNLFPPRAGQQGVDRQLSHEMDLVMDFCPLKVTEV